MPESKPVSTIDELEAHGLERAAAFSQTGSAYALEHATRLNTIDFVLASSPIALLSWIGKKFVD
jgi:microsomal epoxide hydrolase